MNKRTWISASVLMAMALGCGDDEEKKLTPESACEKICAKMEAADCRRTDPDCEETCLDDHDATPDKCQAKLEAFDTCFASAKYVCDAQGYASAQGCKKQLDAWLLCANGDVDGEDIDDDDDEPLPTKPTTGTNTGAGLSCNDTSDACMTCAGDACCAQLSACTGDCQSLTTCIENCTTSSCEQACISKYPKGVTALSALGTCLTQQCTFECASDTSDDEPADDEPVTPDQPADDLSDLCLPVTVPDGYCDGLKQQVGHDCPNGKPYADCVLSPTGAANVYCCSK